MLIKRNLENSIWNFTIYESSSLKLAVNMSLLLFIGAIAIIGYLEDNSETLILIKTFGFLAALIIHDLSLIHI